MEDVKNAMKAALEFKDHDLALRVRAHQEYALNPWPEGKTNVWFNGYEVIDANTLRVKYQYGGGDMEMDGEFDVKI